MTTQTNASYLESLNPIIYAGGVGGTPDTKGGGGSGSKSKPKTNKSKKK
jgi:hypothetical protein